MVISCTIEHRSHYQQPSLRAKGYLKKQNQLKTGACVALMACIKTGLIKQGCMETRPASETSLIVKDNCTYAFPPFKKTREEQESARNVLVDFSRLCALQAVRKKGQRKTGPMHSSSSSEMLATCQKIAV